jgi:hypothetical protein
VDALKEHMRLDGVLESNQIIFVCHSMGGIVVRKFVAERAAELIGARGRRLISFLSPPLPWVHPMRIGCLHWLSCLGTTPRK